MGMEIVYPVFAEFQSKNWCVRSDTVFLPLIDFSKGVIYLVHSVPCSTMWPTLLSMVQSYTGGEDQPVSGGDPFTVDSGQCTEYSAEDHWTI